MPMPTRKRFEEKPNACASGVAKARPADQRAGGGATPTLALQSLIVSPIPLAMAKELLVREHYLHSFPGGTHLALGVFRDRRLMGALTLGAGPANAHALVRGAELQDCLTLTRLWLSDELPPNSESRVLGYTLGNLKRHTQLKFLITYADPAQGHLGYIYQSTNWLYTGLSQATPLYDIGDGRLYHPRTLSQIYGTHSLKYLRDRGVQVSLVTQVSKHRYCYFLDPSWKERLKAPVLPYPKPQILADNSEEAQDAT